MSGTGGRPPRLGDLPKAALALAPDAPAVIDGDLRLSHAALDRLVDRFASDLIRRLGPADRRHPGRAGPRVGLCALNGAAHVVAYLAILRAGLVWVPVNPRNGAIANADLCRRAGLDLLLVEEACRSAAGRVTVPTLAIDAALDGGADAGGGGPWPLEDAAEIAAIKFTGGSTGVPKGVLQPVRAMRATIDSLRALYRFDTGTVFLAVAPLTHGASHFVLPVLAGGGALMLLREPERPAILAALRDGGVTMTFMPPTLIHLLLREGGFGPADFPRLRDLIYSAAPMPPALIAEAIARFGPRLSTLYGQTEAPMTITALSAGEMTDPALARGVGRACANVRVAVRRADGRLVERDGEGEIMVSGPLLMAGYLDAPAETAAVLADGWLATGDLGAIDAAGHLRILGRSKEMIISGGYNIYPAEVEAALADHPGVRESCAFGVADPLWGERLEIAVVPRDEGEDPAILAAALKAHVRERLGPVKAPKTVHIVPALPRNAVGKVTRGAVAAMVADQRAGAA